MLRSAAAAAVLALAAFPAHAAPITDPVGDFIPSFAGAQTPDRDVVSASADLVNGNFIFQGTFNGAVGSTAGTVYVFGVNRGQGTARFGAIASNVLFDSVVIVTPNVSTVVRGLLTGEGTTTLAATRPACRATACASPLPIACYPARVSPRTSTPSTCGPARA